jgi:eukaryotic-like serine/threonine-protein kinase
LTVATGQGETKDASLPVRDPEGQPSGVWEPTRLGELVGGKYRISRLLAKGGMGVVYEAQHAIVKRRFAMKFLRPDFACERESLGRFQREAEAAGVLESEHIASVVDFGITPDGSPYIVMEYLVGEGLASLLQREGRLPYERAADLCVQACRGADVAHAAGIIHRDLKPHNLFVCRRDDGTDLLKILDFGIAKLALVKHDLVSTQTGTLLGTPSYMSPEQARGERAIDLRSDVYSLGAILFEMLSGKVPHPGDSANAVLYHISTQPPVSLATVAPELPRPLIELVERALALDPSARPQSAKAFGEDAGRFAKRQAWPEPPNLRTAPFPTGASSSSHGAPAGEAPVPGTEPVRSKGHPAWTWVAVLTVATALATATAVVLSGGRMKSNTKADREPAGLVSPATKERVPANSEPAPPPAPSLPTSPVAPAPATSTRPDGPVAGQAKALAPKHVHAGGRPVGRHAERPAAAAGENARESQGPGQAAEGSKTAKGSFPSASFDPKNPYGSP